MNILEVNAEAHRLALKTIEESKNYPDCSLHRVMDMVVRETKYVDNTYMHNLIGQYLDKIRTQEV